MSEDLTQFDPVACTCPMFPVDIAPEITRYVANTGSCPFCRDLAQKLGALGVPLPKRQNARPRAPQEAA